MVWRSTSSGLPILSPHCSHVGQGQVRPLARQIIEAIYNPMSGKRWNWMFTQTKSSPVYRGGQKPPRNDGHEPTTRPRYQGLHSLHWPWLVNLQKASKSTSVCAGWGSIAQVFHVYDLEFILAADLETQWNLFAISLKNPRSSSPSQLAAKYFHKRRSILVTIFTVSHAGAVSQIPTPSASAFSWSKFKIAHAVYA